jgi:hypothetical protein
MLVPPESQRSISIWAWSAEISGKMFRVPWPMAEGTADKGPPLIHPYYKPSHHDDDSFYRAALSGVQAHHWHFGNMPPVEGITNQDIGQIIQFIRWWQRENGIR